MKNKIVDELYDEKLKRDKIVNQFKRKCACGYNISLMKNGRLLKYKTFINKTIRLFHFQTIVLCYLFQKQQRDK